ncbi:MAG: ABC transporter ATP-binding protein, partial [Clostridiaceae bacterium]|nr:ABC transporter ATP-binding protein [Clostridiaceae bacterium]
LLCGFYQPTKGKILINGIDISRAPYGELIEHISAIFQDFKIFSFKLQDNVVMDAKVDEEKIFKTLEKVQLKERLEELPKGLGTYLYKDFDEEGIELSGGQMQKLAIARALYKDPSIIILDEPTANLDALSEYEIYQNLKDISHGKTSIFISHRLASTRFTDKIIVFNEGRIHEYGSHEELITKNGLYAEMFSKQARYYSQ